MEAPTAAEILTLTKFEALKGASAEDAEEVVASARADFRRFTGLTFAQITDPDEQANVRRAVRGLAEIAWVQSSPETIDTLADFDLIQSFSAGPYSETRRSAEDALKARLLVAWPWVSELLWGLMTPEMRDYWDERFGGSSPAWSVTEMDWDNNAFDLEHLWGA